MRHDHVRDARRPGETTLLRWFTGRNRAIGPDHRSQPEAVRDFLAEHHNHRSGDVNPRDPMPM